MDLDDLNNQSARSVMIEPKDKSRCDRLGIINDSIIHI